ncbi:MAG: FimV/HubP family polar landmark protein, partial [Sedimenticolaceae bacterium]
MPSSKSIASSSLHRVLLCVLLLCGGNADAVTLGNARVNSFLHQPLDVEIDIVGLAPEQNQDLRLRIANQTHFDRLGIAYESFLADFTFAVVRDGPRWLVRVRSDRPMTEPFIDFPLQMNWPGGSLIRQYTLLLDPPARVRPARTTRPRTQPTAPPSQPTPASESTSGPFTYGPVRPGETLWPIAERFKPSGVTTRQMAMALLRANPSAFIDGNVNRLRAGAILTIPSAAFVEELDVVTADVEFAAQNRRWQASVATSQRPVEAPPRAAASAPTATESQSKAADDGAEVATDEQGQLRIVTEKEKLDVASASEQELKEQLLLTMEEIESNRITTGAIESRLARLEGELNRMQELVDLKDAQIAQLQSELSAREAAEVAPTAPAEQQRPDAPQEMTGSAIDAAGPTAATPPARAVTPLPSIDAPPLVAEQVQSSAWYEQYLWVVW